MHRSPTTLHSGAILPAVVGSVAVHGMVFGAVFVLVNWVGSDGGDATRLAIGVAPPLLRAPPFVESDDGPTICPIDEERPQPRTPAEEFPTSLLDALVTADQPPLWLRAPPNTRSAGTASADSPLPPLRRTPAAAAPELPAVVAVATAAPVSPPLAATLDPPHIAEATCPPPDYPRRAQRRGLQGTVWLRLEVAADGRPDTVILEVSSGHAELDEAALTAARGWRLDPARANGISVPGVLRVPVLFRLTGQDASLRK
jgi:protein TonB